MQSAEPKFSCPACGKRYRWKPEMAGRSAKCACGGKLVVPAQQPATENPVAIATKPELSAMKPAPANASPPPAASATTKCPSCGANFPAGAVLCVNCGYNTRTGKTLAAVVVEEGDDEADDADAPPAKDAPTATGKRASPPVDS